MVCIDIPRHLNTYQIFRFAQKHNASFFLIWFLNFDFLLKPSSLYRFLYHTLQNYMLLFKMSLSLGCLRNRFPHEAQVHVYLSTD